MKARFGRSAAFALITALALLASSCKSSQKPEQASNQPAPQPAPSVPSIKVTPSVQEKAKTPKPGPKATKKPDAETFGNGKASVHLKGSRQQRSFWAEQLDVDGSGNPVLVNEAWDNHDKVFYISNDRTFTCGNGQTATGSTLMAIYAKGNPRKMPAGSGWWATELKKGDCAVPRDDIYGCRFDAAGNNSDCGAVQIVQAGTGDVVITPLGPADGSQSGASSQAAPGTSNAAPAAPSSGASPTQP